MEIIRKSKLALSFSLAFAVLAFVFELLGYSATCTSDDVSIFFTGAILGTLALLAQNALMLAALAPWRRRSLTWAESAILSFNSIINLLILAMNWRLVRGVLGSGETPCFLFRDFTDYTIPPWFSGEYRPIDVFIGVSYGLFPCASAVFCLVLILLKKKSSLGKSE